MTTVIVYDIILDSMFLSVGHTELYISDENYFPY